MDNDEIMMRLKRHNKFFEELKDKIDDQRIYILAKRYMEMLFFELIKNNIKTQSKL
jgi:hypothetical protein